MSSQSVKQARLMRQASVLHEIQENQEKDSLESRYVRLMAELSTLCGDRNNILTAESLTYLSTAGRAEPVKLEREAEKAPDALSKSKSGSSKQEEILSADAARRQRVEELTRFFMEAKSDIEFALGGGREFRELKDKDKESETEREDDETAEEDDEDKTAAAAANGGEEVAQPDPQREAARMHSRLLRDKIDNRVYNIMLAEMREKDPALFGAILCHPLVTGADPKKDKKKKKKRKDRDRKEKSQSTSTMLTPDFTAEPLSAEELDLNVSKFVARAIADGTLQGLMLAAKLVLAWLAHANQVKSSNKSLPLLSHLRVMHGESAPPFPKKVFGAGSDRNAATDKETSKKASEESTNEESPFKLAGVMDLEAETRSLERLRARLSRFGDDGDDEDEDDEEREEGNNVGEEGVDEDALMARAIALSLSPEMNLRDQAESQMGGSPEPMKDTAMSPAAAEKSEGDTPIPRPQPFSAEEFFSLGPFVLPKEGLHVAGLTVVAHLITQLSKLCLEYMESCKSGILPSNCPVQVHPLTFMLVNSLLSDFSSREGDSDDASGLAAPVWRLAKSCSTLSLLRVLEANLFHIEVTGTIPGSVGLGHIAKTVEGENSGGNPLVESLKAHVLQHFQQCADAPGDATPDPVGAIINSASFTVEGVAGVSSFYSRRVCEQALATWVRAIPHFYPTQLERHQELVANLEACHAAVQSGVSSTVARWRFNQLDLLCARLALPDLAQHFVPRCSDLVKSSQSQQVDQPIVHRKTIGDSVLQNTSTKGGKHKAKWSPDVIRESVNAGSITLKCLLEYLTEHAPAHVLDKSGIQSLAVGDARAAEVLTSAYEDMWSYAQRQDAEAVDCVERLTGLLASLRDSVLNERWANFSFSEDYELTHAPLIPVLERLKRPDLYTLNARILLIRSIQDLMIQRIGGSHGDEPSPLEYDPSRCAETMTLSDGNRTAKQCTAKQWGMAMATTGCPPNTGIHEWAVRLDRCEKGHIFLGVCTRDASVATYVGGDRQGWGLIGTRALWHNRSKVRGDYGDGFSTGSTVRVRLNTDSGALSFGVDDTDWGIAFDGLTQHGTLYPAIGLYQRDDQVTILPVQSSDEGAFSVGQGESSQRSVSVPVVLKPFLHHASSALEQCCAFLSSPELIQRVTSEDPEMVNAGRKAVLSHPLLLAVISPLVSSLGLTRTFHGLSSILAMQFVPWCATAAKALDFVINAICKADGGKQPSLDVDVSGEWELKSMAAGNIPAQQYHLSLTQAPDGSVTGRSSGSFTTVTLNGVVRGTKVCFVETWRQGGTCLVEGRLRVDGKEFSGTYEDAKSHTCGSIVGSKVKDSSSSDECGGSKATVKDLVVLEMAIANLFGCFCHSLIEGSKFDLLVESLDNRATDEEVVRDSNEGVEDEADAKPTTEGSNEAYEEWVNSQLLSGGLPLSIVKNHLNHVLGRISELTQLAYANNHLPILFDSSQKWLQTVIPKTATTTMEVVSGGSSNMFLQDLINGRGDAQAIDRWVARHVGESPFVRLGGEPMKVARRTVCAAMIWHSGFLGAIGRIVESIQGQAIDSEVRPHENLMHIWRAAQRVIEWAIRAKNSMGSTYQIVAALVIRKAEFLLDIEPSSKALAAASAVSILSNESPGGPMSSKSVVYECAERIYSEVLMQISRFLESPIRISRLQSWMLANSTWAFLRSVGFVSMKSFIGDSNSSKSALTESHAAPASFALSSALQWLSPMLHEIRFSSGGDFSSAGDLSSSQKSSQETDSFHYLSGMDGCGKHLKDDIRESFESLYSHLCATLSRSTWGKDTDLQLVILQAWGIIISPDDHAFLSRVGIFRVLQTVLDEARSESQYQGSASPTSTLDDKNLFGERKKKVVQATLKVVHLLAAQVAHAGDVADGLLSASELPASPGLSLGSIPLLRKPSGPETLGKSVFHMLYTELKNSLEELRSKNFSSNMKADIGLSTAEPTEGDTGPTDIDSSDSANDAFEYCYQICSLLYSVSGSPVCRSHLSSSRWLKLLLSLVEVKSAQIQRRILKLLRRLLPSLDPTTIRVRYDELDSFDMDSDDDVDSDADGGHAASLIKFFISIVALISPPSLAEMMMHRLAGDNAASSSSSSTKFVQANSSGLVAEVVLLLRSLYESPKWTVYLNQAVVESLSSIPMACVTESSVTSPAGDTDVDMEDASREVPSLPAWTNQMTAYSNALSALCVLDGHIEGLQVGASVKIMPRSGSSLQEAAFRGARGVVVAYEPEKSAAEVLICGNRSSEAAQHSLTTNGILPTRPVRVPVEDLYPIPEVELATSVFSRDVLRVLLVDKFSFFLSEIKKSLAELKSSDLMKNAETPEDSEDEDEISNDGSSSPGGMDSEMASAGGVESEVDSEIASNPSPRHAPTTTQNGNASVEPNDIFSEMEKESKMHRMLLCQHGLRASAMLLKDQNCAAEFIRGVGPRGLIDLLSVAVSDTPTGGLGDIASLEESWLFLWARWYAIRDSFFVRKDKKEDAGEGDDNANANAAPNPLVQQMMEMGFPREWCEVALSRCSHNVEAAINFCFEHSGDMERLLAQHKASQEAPSGAAKSRKDDADAISPLLEQLSEMGFPQNWCKKALAANRNNVDAALTWILSNGEALEAEDRREEEARARPAGDDSKDTPPESQEERLRPNPLRAVSGQASIGEHDMMVEGLVGGGFASVGAPDCIVSSGRWYYEAVLLTNGCIQIGWADVAFCGAADRGDGVGDGPHSWAYDGWRQQKWHGQSSPWGSKWKQGDVVGCAVDADAGTIIFSLNGKMKSANMGVAFRSIQFAGGVYPCASFNRREKLQFNLGGMPFKYPPPVGFQPIIHVLNSKLATLPADAAKGFGVVGIREHSLEETVGEENYSGDSRYFPRDVHPSMLRSSTGHGRNALASSSSKSDMLAELKAIPDDRVFLELLLVTRSLAILQARRAVLTLLTKWPTEQLGSFTISKFLSDGSSSKDDSTRFMEFVKLVSGLGGQMLLSVGLTPASMSLSDSDVSHLLDVGATGRHSLALLSTVVRSAFAQALPTVNNMEGQDPLVDVVLSTIASEVGRASERQYARVPWDAPDAVIGASLLQISSEAGLAWSDKEVLNHPNIFFAEWLTGIVMGSLCEPSRRDAHESRNQIRQQLLQAWNSSLTSPSLCVKERGFWVLSRLLQDMIPKTQLHSHGPGIVARDRDELALLTESLQTLPLQRLVDLAEERLLREYCNVPVCSKYLQSLIELVSSASLALVATGKSIEDSILAQPLNRLAACKQLEKDLFSLNLSEFEEAKAARAKLLEEAEEARKLAELKDDEAMPQETSTNDEAKEDEKAREEAGAGSNMDIDNSDSEEPPDITLSAIANMVAEDSDVVAAAAAIAAAANNRVLVKRPSKAKPEKKVDEDFEYVFPEEEIQLDTSMLNDEERVRLEEATFGVMGPEPVDWRYGSEPGVLSDTPAQLWSGTVTQWRLRREPEGPEIPELVVGCKVIRGPNWKWKDQDGGEGSIGVVEGVSPWSGIEGEGMSVRWPNDSMYTYRWGADGNYDLIHVEVDEENNITTKHPTPKAKSDDEGSFGSELHLGVLLHLFESDGPADDGAVKVTGIMEWSDYGAAVSVVGRRYQDGTLCIQELQLTRGNADMGWMLRFGTEKWQPGTRYMLRPVVDGESGKATPDQLRGGFSHSARKKGTLVEVSGEIVLSTKHLFTMDAHNHFSTLRISDGGLTVACTSGESRNLALGTVGFATGIHYWEVRIDQAEFGSVFIGVCEKAGPPGSQAALSSRLNRWHGWGFVNFRATYHNSTERIYGDHFNAGDTIGVCLDMEQGKLAFFMDGIKYGEHIVADLGVAFENMKGERNSRTLYPCIGMRKCGDQVSLNEKWISMTGVSPRQVLKDTVDVSDYLHSWYMSIHGEKSADIPRLPDRLLRESWAEWRRWNANRWQRYPVRPRGVVVDFDTYPSSCSAVSKAAGLEAPFLAGDRVRICSKGGRELDQPEEAVVLGVYRGFLWYRTETQGNEGAEEGRSWAWYWSPSELMELILIKRDGKDMTLLENSATVLSLADKPYVPVTEQEAQAATSFEAFVDLATRSHTTTSDMQLVERLNTYCAAIGVDMTNLCIEDVMTPDENSMVEDNGDGATRPPSGRTRTHSLVLEDYFSAPALKSLTGPELRARCVVLRVLNSKILRVLPFINLQPSDASSAAIEVTGSTSSSSGNQWQFISTSHKLRALRRLVFTSTKCAFWDSVLRATTTSTPLPSDEYEDPREIRVIRINRIQAQASKLSLLAQPGDRLRRSVFGQLYREMRTWNDSNFRRAYCGKGHGGQRRAFKVKFLGEGVNDYGGPYRAVFEQIVDELQMDNIELSKGEQGLLPLLVPCPNRRSGTGSNQDKFLLNPSCGASMLSNGPMALELHRFLGKVIGTAVRHGLQMGLDLPSLVWRPLAGLDVGRAHLESIDVVTANNLRRIEECTPDTAEDMLEHLTFSTPLSDGTEVALCPNGESIPVTYESRTAYVQQVEKTRLTESSQQLAALKEGLAAVLPLDLTPLFTPRELEVLICGRREVDVDLLRQCTEYDEGVDESMPHVQFFWEVLKEMTSEERTSFLRFVWARSRMPNSAKDFPMNFKVQSAHDQGARVEPDKYLPHAQTCFFSLSLPAYTTKEVLRAKLLYAIQNSPNMDADVRLHNAEGWADA
ncbi:TPA: hypothetical protein N0F65_006070 [Lagenidium giganteum]|uniref:Uncharacterized protein n=1 Tax=Lagenidium giganteum TaxID=4803 RepID=A0AAV2YQV6_9STRA|nr:TPA: hypothetical protein N0F65_006070 [Lagenidium giganteum]